jgi:anthranilate synthase/indole-3-glycerol phosphate synthase/phosphoribosylanthranilate isomerase
MALAAEFKRASPSKGAIAPHLHAGEQAQFYHQAGACIISILTEARWFQGSLEDLTLARQSTTTTSGGDSSSSSSTLLRPAILRKDFCVNEYMIAQAAAAGADTILLIVAILPQHLLARLIDYARTTCHMEPLVEVHGDDELQVAIDAGAKVIGVNNRNLHTFQLDLETSERIATKLQELQLQFVMPIHDNNGHNDHHGDDHVVDKEQVVLPEYTLCALSGMSTALDVDRYRRAGIAMCLIGESLMRATDPALAIRSLCLDPRDFAKLQQQRPLDENIQGAPIGGVGGGGAYIGGTKLIKVCGITNAEDALVACQAGANLIGIIFVPNSKRCVTVEQAKEVVQAVQAFGERTGPVALFGNAGDASHPSSSHTNPLFHLIASSQALETVSRRRPLVVGVFQNQESEYIKTMVEQCGLDLVQLHGQEGMAAANAELCGAPAIRVVDMETDPTTDGTSSLDAAETLLHSLTCDPVVILLDTSVKGAGGGTGVTFDWNIAHKVQASGLPVIIAGGLDPTNVQDAVSTIRPWGVDVSSGVEEQPGQKNHDKLQAFVEGAREASLEASKGI